MSDCHIGKIYKVPLYTEIYSHPFFHVSTRFFIRYETIIIIKEIHSSIWYKMYDIKDKALYYIKKETVDQLEELK